MKTFITSILLLITISSQAQFQSTAGIIKTLKTKYAKPGAELSVAYKHHIFTTEAGLKTNWSEYYSMFYASIGTETKGKFLLAVNFGMAWTANIPQQDRKYQDGQYIYLSKGYTTTGIWAAYSSARVGYQLMQVNDVAITPFAAISYSWKNTWLSAGIKLSLTNEE